MFGNHFCIFRTACQVGPLPWIVFVVVQLLSSITVMYITPSYRAYCMVATPHSHNILCHLVISPIDQHAGNAAGTRLRDSHQTCPVSVCAHSWDSPVRRVKRTGSCNMKCGVSFLFSFLKKVNSHAYARRNARDDPM